MNFYGDSEEYDHDSISICEVETMIFGQLSPLWKFPADMSKARAVLWPHSCHFNKRDEDKDEDHQDQDQDQDPC